MVDQKEGQEKKPKKPNFTDRETEVLLEEVGLEYPIIVSRLQNAITVKKKRAAWQNVVARVNAVGGHNRELEACKKRWKDLKATYLNKPKLDAGTGGGKPAPPVPYEDVIRQIIGDDTNLTCGIDGGGDTYNIWTITEETAGDETLVPVIGPELDNLNMRADATESVHEVEEMPDSPLCSTLLEDSCVHNFTLPLGETQGSQSQVIDLKIPSTSGSSSSKQTTQSQVIDLEIPSTSGSSSSRQTTQVISSYIKRKAMKRRAERVTSEDQAVDEEETEAVLTKRFLKTQIQKNETQILKNEIKMKKDKVSTEVQELMKEKLKLEIEMLKNISSN